MVLGLYTTIHPGIRPFLKDWYASLSAQTDTEIDLWIGIDEMHIDEARAAMGGVRPGANWIRAEPGATPAQVRERAWRTLIPHVDAVVMVDADDVMGPRRIEHAREHIAECDVGACGLELVDEEGNDLGYAMPPPEYEAIRDILPHHNIFGLSNSVYWTRTLKKSLPLPDDTTLIDWYLATQAWLRGDDLSIDPSVHMRYRQHQHSTLSLLPPYSTEDVCRTARAVRNHFLAIAHNLPTSPQEDRLEAFWEGHEQIQRFEERILNDAECLKTYTSALNQRGPLTLWWGCVAHPELSHLWE